MSERTESVIPPQWYVDRVNSARPPGLRPLTALDPLAMLLWHQATTCPPEQLIIVTGV